MSTCLVENPKTEDPITGNLAPLCLSLSGIYRSWEVFAGMLRARLWQECRLRSTDLRTVGGRLPPFSVLVSIPLEHERRRYTTALDLKITPYGKDRIRVDLSVDTTP